MNFISTYSELELAVSHLRFKQQQPGNFTWFSFCVLIVIIFLVSVVHASTFLFSTFFHLGHFLSMHNIFPFLHFDHKNKRTKIVTRKRKNQWKWGNYRKWHVLCVYTCVCVCVIYKWTLECVCVRWVYVYCENIAWSEYHYLYMFSLSFPIFCRLFSLSAFFSFFWLYLDNIFTWRYIFVWYIIMSVFVCVWLTIIYSPPFYLMIKLFYFIFLVSFVLAYINTYMVLQHSWYVFCGVCKLSVSVLACHSCFLLRFSFWICKNIAQRFECVCA